MTWQLEWRDRTYEVADTAREGDIADVYDATYTEPGLASLQQNVVIKVPRDPDDSDLLLAESTALQEINTSPMSAQYGAYVPTLVDSFRYTDPKTDDVRRVNVQAKIENAYSLAEVKEQYPNGVGPRDIAWMWRRLLVAIGYVHRTGWVHGGLTPDNILIVPDDHGVILADWCYSVPKGEALTAFIDKRQVGGFYPPAVFDKKPTTELTDIYTATRSMSWLVADNAPTWMAAFAQLAATNKCPTDAWELKDAFDALLEREYGPRKFVPFAMPKGTP